jgi:hypothetical protein
MIAKVKEMVDTDVWLNTKQIYNILGILLGAVHAILKRNMKMKKNCAGGIPPPFADRWTE